MHTQIVFPHALKFCSIEKQIEVIQPQQTTKHSSQSEQVPRPDLPIIKAQTDTRSFHQAAPRCNPTYNPEPRRTSQAPNSNSELVEIVIEVVVGIS